MVVYIFSVAMFEHMFMIRKHTGLDTHVPLQDFNTYLAT
jgi:hypothetical protein